MKIVSTSCLGKSYRVEKFVSFIKLYTYYLGIYCMRFLVQLQKKYNYKTNGSTIIALTFGLEGKYV